MIESYFILILAIVLLIDLLIATAKSALSHIRLPYLFNLREKDQVNVDRTIKVIERFRVRTSLRLALILCHFIFAALMFYIFASLLPTLHPLLHLLLVVAGMLVIILLEFLLEGLVLKNPEKTAMRLRGFVLAIDLLFTPFAMLMTAQLGNQAEAAYLPSMTDEELRSWVEKGEPEGSLEKGEREMIYSIFRFGDTMAREVMVPRIDVLALDINATIGEARKTFIDAGHSRVPVFEDTIDNVIGLLYAKDLLANLSDETTIADNRQILRTAFFVPEVKKVDELLTEMQSRGVHMVLVVDEYGGVAGVVTLEDIVEEIVGEIRDEYDEAEEQPFQMINTDEYVFLGSVSLDDFNEVTALQINTDNADTLGGFIYGEMGHVPVVGESVQTEGAIFTVEEVMGRRIRKVRARIHPKSTYDKENNHVDS